MTLQVSFVLSVYAAKYITEIICTEVAEAIRKTEIALQLPVMNTIYFDTKFQLPYFHNPSTAILLSDSVAIRIHKLSFFICFMLCTTRVSPVGISRHIYRICFYMNVSMCCYLHNCLCSF
jgi:hypothetical protein